MLIEQLANKICDTEVGRRPLHEPRVIVPKKSHPAQTHHVVSHQVTHRTTIIRSILFNIAVNLCEIV